MDNEDKAVMIFPRGQLTAADRRELKRAGVVAVEADDPSLVVQAVPMAPMVPLAGGDDVGMAAYEALVDSNNATTAYYFLRRLHARIQKRETER